MSEWIDEHIEWIGGTILSLFSGVVVFFSRSAWNDRKNVMTELATIKKVQNEHTVKIEVLEQEVHEAEIQAANDRKEIIEMLENQHREKTRTNEIMTKQITLIYGAVKNIEGRIDPHRKSDSKEFFDES